MSKRTATQAAFTLVEVLVVVSVVLALLAITVPVLNSGRRSANRALVMSNMRQCLIAIAMYTDENDGRSLPSRGELLARLDPRLLRNPYDTWRGRCPEEVESQMVGSYGYAGAFGLHRFWAQGSGAALLVDVFFDNPPIPVPMQMKLDQATDPSQIAFLPRTALVGRADTSVTSVKFRWFDIEKNIHFNWFHIFMRLNNPNPKLRRWNPPRS